MQQSTETASGLESCSPRIAAELLRGAGAASVTLYRRDEQPTLEAYAHCMHEDGSLLLACAPAAQQAGDAVEDVRIDFFLEAPEAEVRILAASAHMLASLEWVSVDDLADDWPEALQDAAAAPGVRLAVIRAESMLIHDAAGVSRLELSAVLESAPQIDVGVHLPARREAATIALEVMTGLRPGAVLSSASLPARFAHLTGRAFIVDASPSTLTLMHIGQQRISTVRTCVRQSVRGAPVEA